MPNSIEFIFNIKEKKLGLEDFKKVLKKVAGKDFNEKNVSIKKSGNPNDPSYYNYHHSDKREEIGVNFYGYEKSKKLVIFVPNWKNGPSYCINIIKLIYSILKCGGYGHETFAFDEESNHRTVEEIKKTRIWAVNLFTSEEIKKYGREKILSAPCEKIEELEDGAIITMIHKNNFYSAEDSFYSTFEEREKLRKHLNDK
ncbi:hypothetical protein HYT57_04270 [Candidatus Woesearchaeota archaeon]|nr:hypothetical protein [Candidatus Woesearchaeota archaeon]